MEESTKFFLSLLAYFLCETLLSALFSVALDFLVELTPKINFNVIAYMMFFIGYIDATLRIRELHRKVDELVDNVNFLLEIN